MQTLTKLTYAKTSFGNKKLPKSTLIFNLPAVKTCPGKTKFCASFCYALKAERLYPDTYPARKHNLKLSLQDNFVSIMIETIQKLQYYRGGKKKGKSRIDTVRIHESGDFYSQDYLKSWYTIAKEFPSIIFYAYTKSFELSFTDKPSNVVLIASFDKTTTERQRIVYSMKKDIFDNTFSIIGKKDKASCIADCRKCNNCWMKTGQHITVNQH